jgi:hypothetical protein
MLYEHLQETDLTGLETDEIITGDSLSMKILPPTEEH